MSNRRKFLNRQNLCKNFEGKICKNSEGLIGKNSKVRKISKKNPISHSTTRTNSGGIHN